MLGGLSAYLLQREPFLGGQSEREGPSARTAAPVRASCGLREARPTAALVVQQGKPPAWVWFGGSMVCYCAQFGVWLTCFPWTGLFYASKLCGSFNSNLIWRNAFRLTFLCWRIVSLVFGWRVSKASDSTILRRDVELTQNDTTSIVCGSSINHSS